MRYDKLGKLVTYMDEPDEKDINEPMTKKAIKPNYQGLNKEELRRLWMESYDTIDTNVEKIRKLKGNGKSEVDRIDEKKSLQVLNELIHQLIKVMGNIRVKNN